MKISIQWFPPSWVQIKYGGWTIYIDPAYLRTHFMRYPKKIEYSRWPDPVDGLPEGLGPADIILVTHAHKDHCKAVTINRLRNSGTRVIAPKGCVKELGDALEIIHAGDEVVFKDIKIKAVHSYNTEAGSSTRKVHRKGRGVGYVITFGGKSVYHAGDTDVIPEMKKLGKIDLALLPIGGTFTMDIGDAVRAAMMIKPQTVIPMHCHKADPDIFRQRLSAKSGIRVVPLLTGGSYSI